MTRDWIRVGSASIERGRTLTTTPHHIGMIVAHDMLRYGSVIEDAHGGHVVKCLRRAIFEAARRAIVEYSEPPA